MTRGFRKPTRTPRGFIVVAALLAGMLGSCGDDNEALSPTGPSPIPRSADGGAALAGEFDGLDINGSEVPHGAFMAEGDAALAGLVEVGEIARPGGRVGQGRAPYGSGPAAGNAIPRGPGSAAAIGGATGARVQAPLQSAVPPVCVLDAVSINEIHRHPFRFDHRARAGDRDSRLGFVQRDCSEVQVAERFKVRPRLGSGLIIDETSTADWVTLATPVFEEGWAIGEGWNGYVQFSLSENTTPGGRWAVVLTDLGTRGASQTGGDIGATNIFQGGAPVTDGQVVLHCLSANGLSRVPCPTIVAAGQTVRMEMDGRITFPHPSKQRRLQQTIANNATFFDTWRAHLMTASAPTGNVNPNSHWVPGTFRGRREDFTWAPASSSVDSAVTMKPAITVIGASGGNTYAETRPSDRDNRIARTFVVGNTPDLGATLQCVDRTDVTVEVPCAVIQGSPDANADELDLLLTVTGMGPYGPTGGEESFTYSLEQRFDGNASLTEVSRDTTTGTSHTYRLRYRTLRRSSANAWIQVELADTSGYGSGRVYPAVSILKRRYRAPAPDPPARNTLSVAAGSATEGDAVSFTVTVDRPAELTAEDVSFKWTAGSETATEGTDFETIWERSLTIAASETTGTFRVQTIEDTRDEPDENFSVTIYDPVNAVLTDARVATGTITDDDEAGVPTTSYLSVADGEAVEGNSVAFAVRLAPASTAAVTVDYETSDRGGGAVAGTDYTAVDSTLSFAAGETSKTVSVSTTDDSADEPYRERFNLTLSGASGAVIRDGNAIGSIIDNDDAPQAYASISDAAAVEEGRAASFTVDLSAETTSTVTVSYRTAGRQFGIDGVAYPGSDYTETSGTLSFTAGERSKSFTVSTTDDTEVEPTETFPVEISSSDVEVTRDVARGTITDNDVGTPVTPVTCTPQPGKQTWAWGEVYCGELHSIHAGWDTWKVSQDRGTTGSTSGFRILSGHSPAVWLCVFQDRCGSRTAANQAGYEWVEVPVSQ